MKKKALDRDIEETEKAKNIVDETLKVKESVLDQVERRIANEREAWDENVRSQRSNLEFELKESEKYFVKKINIFGNNVTQENVIRNQLIIDEGDPYNEILLSKSVNNIKSLNIFKSVKQEINDDDKIVPRWLEVNERVCPLVFYGDVLDVEIEIQRYLKNNKGIDENDFFYYGSINPNIKNISL